MWEVSLGNTGGVGSERERERQLIKGTLLTSYPCGQLPLNPTGSSGNRPEHVLWSYLLGGLEEGCWGIY